MSLVHPCGFRMARPIFNIHHNKPIAIGGFVGANRRKVAAPIGRAFRPVGAFRVTLVTVH